MSKRKYISKGVRFEIFKRDNFTCQYCGATPPSVVLHIDHIKPVAGGGENTEDNLITACQACNTGKGSRPLRLAPMSLHDKAEEIAEREAQIKGYAAVLQERKDRIEAEVWKIAAILDEKFATSIRRDWYASIKRFLERLSYPEVEDAMEIACSKFRFSTRKAFLYFCGICWNRIRESEHGSHTHN